MLVGQIIKANSISAEGIVPTKGSLSQVGGLGFGFGFGHPTHNSLGKPLGQGF